MKLSLGRTVLVNTSVPYNGSTVHPAMITRVWGTDDTKNGPQAANLVVFVDGNPPVNMSSVMVFDEPTEKACEAYWPLRV